jgi:hypothetical protein
MAGIAAMGETDWRDVGKLQSLESGFYWLPQWHPATS